MSIPENGQTHANNSSAVADELFECVWIFSGVGAESVNINPYSIWPLRTTLGFLHFKKLVMIFIDGISFEQSKSAHHQAVSYTQIVKFKFPEIYLVK